MQTAVENDLKQQREVSVQQLQTQATDQSTTERELYSVGVKLRTVLEENDRFRNALRKLEADEENLIRSLEESAAKKDRLVGEVDEQKLELLRAWLVDRDMTEATAQRDQTVVDQFSDLLMRTGERQDLISIVSRNLHEELDKLAGFLQNVSTKRPKASRRATKKPEDMTAVTGMETPHPPGSYPASRQSSRSTQPINTNSNTRSSMTTPRSTTRPPSLMAKKSNELEDKF